MKPVAPAILLLFAITASAQTAAMSGNWKLHMEWPEGSSDGTCTFQQEGASLSGTCGEKDRFPISGQIEGDQLTWTVGIEGFRMEFTGQLDASRTTVSGHCVIVGENMGRFTLQRVD